MPSTEDNIGGRRSRSSADKASKSKLNVNLLPRLPISTENVRSPAAAVRRVRFAQQSILLNAFLHRLRDWVSDEIGLSLKRLLKDASGSHFNLSSAYFPRWIGPLTSSYGNLGEMSGRIEAFPPIPSPIAKPHYHPPPWPPPIPRRLRPASPSSRTGHSSSDNPSETPPPRTRPAGGARR